jgi:hypothetical protein
MQNDECRMKNECGGEKLEAWDRRLEVAPNLKPPTSIIAGVSVFPGRA